MEWFLLKSGKVEGPITESELLEQLHGGSLSDSDLACKKGSTHWSSIVDVEKEIKSQEEKNKEIIPEIKPWILLLEKADDPKLSGHESPYTQQGPFSTGEIVDLLQSGAARYSDYVWKSGFERWIRINEIDEFFNKSASVETPSVEIAIPTPEKIEILQQAKAVSLLNFVEEPSISGVVDEVATVPVTIESVIIEAHEKEITVEKVVEPSFDFKINLDREQAPEIEEAEEEETTVFQKAEMNLLPWVLGSLSVAMVGLLALWFTQREKIPLTTPITNHVTPAPIEKPKAEPKAPRDVGRKTEAPAVSEAARIKPTPDINANAPREELREDSIKIEKISSTSQKAEKIKSIPGAIVKHSRAKPSARHSIAPKPKVILKHSVHKKDLLKSAKILEIKAESLDSKYQSLRDSPLNWRRFYSQWTQELQEANLANVTGQPVSKKFAKSLALGKNRLLERAAMMDRSIVKEVPVSSDFQNENLAETFRELAKKIRE